MSKNKTNNLYKHPERADNRKEDALKKIQLLPVSVQSKKILSKLVTNSLIEDVIKLMKTSDRSVTLHTKVNIKNSGAQDAVIKIYAKDTKFYDEIFAYSKNCDHQETRYCKNKANMLGKVDELSVPDNMKKALSHLIIKHVIDEITQFLTICNEFVVFSGKISINKTTYRDVIMKVYANSGDMWYQFHAESEIYTKSFHNELSPKIVGHSMEIETFGEYIRENIVLYKMDNVLILKMFKNSKSIEKMIKKFPEKRDSFYNEILDLYSQIRKKDYRIWHNPACSMKHVIWHDGKWIIMSGSCDIKSYCNHSYDHIHETIADIIKLFQAHGMSNENLKKGLLDQRTENATTYRHQLPKSVLEDIFGN